MKWISVLEKMPEKDVEVIGFDAYYDRVFIAKVSASSSHLVFVDSDDCFITHWMPKPKRPTEKAVAAVHSAMK